MDLQAALGAGDEQAGAVLADGGAGRQGLCVLTPRGEAHFWDQRLGPRAALGHWDGQAVHRERQVFLRLGGDKHKDL